MNYTHTPFTIKIDGKKYTSYELHEVCSHRLKDPDLPPWEKYVFAFLKQWIDHKDYIEVQTSGSTGKPKSIRLKKHQMAYSARQTCQFFSLNDHSTALLCLPAGYIAGKMMIVRALVSGMNLLLAEPKGNPFEHLDREIDFIAITPFQLHQSMATLEKCTVIKQIIIGGGEISSVLEKKSQSITASVYATFGMTETSSHIALRKVNGKDRSNWFTVIGDTQISVDNRSCLTLYNPYLFDGTLITNDRVEIKEDRMFRWLGRSDNIINTGGIKVCPEEVEQKISVLLSEKIVITSVADHVLGNAITLVIEKQQLDDPDLKKLLNEIKQILPPYLVPKRVKVLKRFPLTPGGKTDRRKIAEMMSEPQKTSS